MSDLFRPPTPQFSDIFVIEILNAYLAAVSHNHDFEPNLYFQPFAEILQKTLRFYSKNTEIIPTTLILAQNAEG